jgi:hypothetical protein
VHSRGIHPSRIVSTFRCGCYDDGGKDCIWLKCHAGSFSWEQGGGSTYDWFNGLGGDCRRAAFLFPFSSLGHLDLPRWNGKVVVPWLALVCIDRSSGLLPDLVWKNGECGQREIVSRVTTHYCSPTSQYYRTNWSPSANVIWRFW